MTFIKEVKKKQRKESGTGTEAGMIKNHCSAWYWCRKSDSE
jgi:hypothetical protein